MPRVEAYLAAQLATRPDAPALIDSSGLCWSFLDLDRASNALAEVMRANGVLPCDRVMVLSENCCAAVAALFAAWKVGATALPVNARQSPSEIDRILTHAAPAMILATAHISPEAAAHARGLGAKEITGDFGSLQMVARDSDPDADLHDVAVLLYTTGTTGDPKGVMLTHENLRFGGKSSATLREMTPDDVIYGVLPITHVFGLASVVTAAVYAGAQVRLEARFSAVRMLAALRDGVTLMSGVPQMHAHLMQHLKEQGQDQLGSSALRYVSSGAAPLDPTWKRNAEAFYGVALQNGYGMTETTAGVCASRNPFGSRDISCGPALPGVEVKIGEAEEILTRGPHIMKGYFRNPEETARVLDQDGWLHTGDLGRIDAQGNLHILGRKKELIIHGGFNVYPPEVEAALNDHPQVIQSAVIGRAVDGDEEVLAFVQHAEGDAPDPSELSSFVKARLAGYKRPSRIILATSLPAAPTGKLLKHKLLETFHDQLS